MTRMKKRERLSKRLAAAKAKGSKGWTYQLSFAPPNTRFDSRRKRITPNTKRPPR
jgi:hypothetical protein